MQDPKQIFLDITLETKLNTTFQLISVYIP